MNSSTFFSTLDPDRSTTAEGVVQLTPTGIAVGSKPLVAPLPQLGFITVQGADAATFLHGQLSNEVQRQPLDQAQLSAYCTAKGRMLASFVQWQDRRDGAAAITLALSKELAAAIAKRLGMFVLRAKATVSDASDAWVAFGWIGDPADFPALSPDATLPDAVWARAAGPELTVIRVPPVADRARALIVVPAAGAPSVWAALSAAATAVAPQVWQLTEIHAGLPRIVAANQEQFVPQMINFEILGGVNFKKGCYPGQEVVARSQYLGKLRRRMFLARTDASGIADGADVHADDGAEPVGRVVNAVANGRGGTDLLVETTLSASESPLRVGAAALTLLALPYTLPAEQGAA